MNINIKENLMLDNKLLDILACPKCKSSLKYDKEKQLLECLNCKKKFEVKNDIPILLLEDEK